MLFTRQAMWEKFNKSRSSSPSYTYIHQLETFWSWNIALNIVIQIWAFIETIFYTVTALQLLSGTEKFIFFVLYWYQLPVFKENPYNCSYNSIKFPVMLCFRWKKRCKVVGSPGLDLNYSYSSLYYLMDHSWSKIVLNHIPIQQDGY